MKLLDSQYNIGIIALVCFGIYFVHLDVLYANIMEARNFVTAREMVSDGNWLLTTLNGLPRYEKPPFPTWIVAFSGTVFDFDNLMFLRLPSAIMTLLMAIYIYKLSSLLSLDRRQSLVNALVMMTSFYVIFAGRNGTWDIFCHAFTVMAVYHFFLFFSSDHQVWKNALLSGLFVGLSFMSKGPVSHYALLLPFLIAYGFVYKFSNFRTKWLPLLSLSILAVLVAGWWYYYIYAFDESAAQTIASKEATAWKDRYVKPIYHYWSFFIQSGVWTVPAFVSLLYPYLKSRVSNLKGYRFALLWTLSSVVLLSLIPEKKERYLMPVMIPLAMNTGCYIEYLIREFVNLKDWKEKVPVYLHFGLISLIGISFPIVGYLFLKNNLAGHYTWFLLSSAGLFLLGILIANSLLKKQMTKAFTSLIAFKVVILSFGFPLANAFLNNPAYQAFASIEDEMREIDLPVYMHRLMSPEIIWDYGDKVPLIDHDGESSLPKENKFAALVRIGEESEFRAAFSDFDIEEIKTLDINPMDSTKRGYKNRMKGKLLLVEKKK